MRTHPASLLVAVACTSLLAGCNDDGDGGEHFSHVTAIYDPSPGRPDFFALPWPMDSRLVLEDDGRRHLDLTGFYNPGDTTAIGQYLNLFHKEPTDGFGTSSATFLRFDGPVDPATLPASAADSLAETSSVFLVDVTTGSPDAGQRIPVRAVFTRERSLYIESNWLAVLPEPGFPMRERTTYAVVVTDDLYGRDQTRVGRDARFTVPETAVPLGVDPAKVVVATVFTTASVTDTMRDLRAATYDQAPPPVVDNFVFDTSDKAGGFDLYKGTYEAPNFQEGDPPYLMTGGRIHRGPDGKPLVSRTETMRFALSVPRAEMPPGGWPVVLYAHGTGGDWVSFVDDGSAARAAKVTDHRDFTIARMAMISIDQVLHGPRDPTGSEPEITFYNFQNLLSARDSGKQGAADDFSLLRLVENMDISKAPNTGVPIKFDKSRIYFLGHSQGGTTGPLFLAFEPKIKAAVLSGAGASLILALIGKTKPLDIPKLVENVVGEPVSEVHPLLTLLQMWLESADPGNYARLYFREPPQGLAPKNIYQSLGMVDNYTPIPTIKALALAMGVQPVNPMAVDGDLPLLSQDWANAPISLNQANKKVTGVLCEYDVPQKAAMTQLYDGHFVIFRHPTAIRQAFSFLATHAATGTAKLVP